MDFSAKTFSIYDYIVFAMMLLISAVVGIYYAVKDRRRQNTEEYLLAGRSMSAYPVSLSLSVSFTSAITILATPAEIYNTGLIFAWIIPAFALASIIASEMFIPTFYKLKFGSVYQYLERRFNKALRMEGTILYMLQTFFYVGVVIYGPALALNAVTGLNLWAAVVATGLVCIFYSSVGGLKAVIWTDAFQAVVMVTGMLSVIIIGSSKLGGYGNVWKISAEGGRTNLWNFSIDPRERMTTWSILIGITFMFLSLYGVNQGQVQRYISCRSLREAKKSVALNIVGLWTLNALAVTCGLVIYAYYKDCDPVSYGIVGKVDQIMPLLAVDIFQDLPGMTGVFIACVYSGSLSTVSTAITAMASVTVEDFLRPHCQLKEATYMWISKCLVVFYGGICILLAFLMSNLKGLMTAGVMALSSFGGPLLGLYSLGLVCPFANSLGALVGTNVAICANLLVVVLSRVYPPPPEFSKPLPFSTELCPLLGTHNASLSTTILHETFTATAELSTSSTPRLAGLNALSTFWYSPFGFIWAFAVGVIVSLLTGGWKERKNVDPRLIHHFFDHWMFKWLPERFRETMRCGVEKSPEDESESEDEKKEKDEEAKTAFLNV